MVEWNSLTRENQQYYLNQYRDYTGGGWDKFAQERGITGAANPAITSNISTATNQQQAVMGIAPSPQVLAPTQIPTTTVIQTSQKTPSQILTEQGLSQYFSAGELQAADRGELSSNYIEQKIQGEMYRYAAVQSGGSVILPSYSVPKPVQIELQEKGSNYVQLVGEERVPQTFVLTPPKPEPTIIPAGTLVGIVKEEAGVRGSYVVPKPAWMENPQTSFIVSSNKEMENWAFSQTIQPKPEGIVGNAVSNIGGVFNIVTSKIDSVVPTQIKSIANAPSIVGSIINPIAAPIAGLKSSYDFIAGSSGEKIKSVTNVVSQPIKSNLVVFGENLVGTAKNKIESYIPEPIKSTAIKSVLSVSPVPTQPIVAASSIYNFVSGISQNYESDKSRKLLATEQGKVDTLYQFYLQNPTPERFDLYTRKSQEVATLTAERKSEMESYKGYNIFMGSQSADINVRQTVTEKIYNQYPAIGKTITAISTAGSFMIPGTYGQMAVNKIVKPSQDISVIQNQGKKTYETLGFQERQVVDVVSLVPTSAIGLGSAVGGAMVGSQYVYQHPGEFIKSAKVTTTPTVVGLGQYALEHPAETVIGAIALEKMVPVKLRYISPTIDTVADSGKAGIMRGIVATWENPIKTIGWETKSGINAIFGRNIVDPGDIPSAKVLGGVVKATGKDVQTFRGASGLETVIADNPLSVGFTPKTLSEHMVIGERVYNQNFMGSSSPIDITMASTAEEISKRTNAPIISGTSNVGRVDIVGIDLSGTRSRILTDPFEQQSTGLRSTIQGSKVENAVAVDLTSGNIIAPQKTTRTEVIWGDTQFQNPGKTTMVHTHVGAGELDLSGISGEQPGSFGMLPSAQDVSALNEGMGNIVTHTGEFTTVLKRTDNTKYGINIQNEMESVQNAATTRIFTNSLESLANKQGYITTGDILHIRNEAKVLGRVEALHSLSGSYGFELGIFDPRSGKNITGDVSAIADLASTSYKAKGARVPVTYGGGTIFAEDPSLSNLPKINTKSSIGNIFGSDSSFTLGAGKKVGDGSVSSTPYWLDLKEYHPFYESSLLGSVKDLEGRGVIKRPVFNEPTTKRLLPGEVDLLLSEVPWERTGSAVEKPAFHNVYGEDITGLYSYESDSTSIKGIQRITKPDFKNAGEVSVYNTHTHPVFDLSVDLISEGKHYVPVSIAYGNDFLSMSVVPSSNDMGYIARTAATEVPRNIDNIQMRILSPNYISILEGRPADLKRTSFKYENYKLHNSFEQESRRYNRYIGDTYDINVQREYGLEQQIGLENNFIIDRKSDLSGIYALGKLSDRSDINFGIYKRSPEGSNNLNFDWNRNLANNVEDFFVFTERTPAERPANVFDLGAQKKKYLPEKAIEVRDNLPQFEEMFVIGKSGEVIPDRVTYSMSGRSHSEARLRITPEDSKLTFAHTHPQQGDMFTSAFSPKDMKTIYELKLKHGDTYTSFDIYGKERAFRMNPGEMNDMSGVPNYYDMFNANLGTLRETRGQYIDRYIQSQKSNEFFDINTFNRKQMYKLESDASIKTGREFADKIGGEFLVIGQPRPFDISPQSAESFRSVFDLGSVSPKEKWINDIEGVINQKSSEGHTWVHWNVPKNYDSSGWKFHVYGETNRDAAGLVANIAPIAKEHGFAYKSGTRVLFEDPSIPVTQRNKAYVGYLPKDVDTPLLVKDLNDVLGSYPKKGTIEGDRMISPNVGVRYELSKPRNELGVVELGGKTYSYYYRNAGENYNIVGNKDIFDLGSERKRVLDVGAGAFPHWDATDAIDYSSKERAIQDAAKFGAPTEPIRSINYIGGIDYNIDKFPFDRWTFDKVESYGSMHAFAEGPNAYRESMRVLAPGGEMLVHSSIENVPKVYNQMSATGFKDILLVKDVGDSRINFAVVGEKPLIPRKSGIFTSGSSQTNVVNYFDSSNIFDVSEANRGILFSRKPGIGVDSWDYKYTPKTDVMSVARKDNAFIFGGNHELVGNDFYVVYDLDSRIDHGGINRIDKEIGLDKNTFKMFDLGAERKSDVMWSDRVSTISPNVVKSTIGREGVFYHAGSSEGLFNQLDREGRAVVDVSSGPYGGAGKSGLYFGPPDTVLSSYLSRDTPGLIRIKESPSAPKTFETTPGRLYSDTLDSSKTYWQYIIPENTEIRTVGKSTMKMPERGLSGDLSGWGGKEIPVIDVEIGNKYNLGATDKSSDLSGVYSPDEMSFRTQYRNLKSRYDNWLASGESPEKQIFMARVDAGLEKDPHIIPKWESKTSAFGDPIFSFAETDVRKVPLKSVGIAVAGAAIMTYAAQNIAEAMKEPADPVTKYYLRSEDDKTSIDARLAEYNPFTKVPGLRNVSQFGEDYSKKHPDAMNYGIVPGMISGVKWFESGALSKDLSTRSENIWNEDIKTGKLKPGSGEMIFKDNVPDSIRTKYGEELSGLNTYAQDLEGKKKKLDEKQTRFNSIQDEYIKSGKLEYIGGKLTWTGSESEYQKFLSDIGGYQSDVDAYNVDIDKFNQMKTGIDTKYKDYLRPATSSDWIANYTPEEQKQRDLMSSELKMVDAYHKNIMDRYTSSQTDFTPTTLLSFKRFGIDKEYTTQDLFAVGTAFSVGWDNFARPVLSHPVKALTLNFGAIPQTEERGGIAWSAWQGVLDVPPMLVQTATYLPAGVDLALQTGIKQPEKYTMYATAGMGIMAQSAVQDPVRFTSSMIAAAAGGKAIAYAGRPLGLTNMRIYFEKGKAPELGNEIPLGTVGEGVDYLRTFGGKEVNVGASKSRPYFTKINAKPGELSGELPTEGIPSIYVYTEKQGIIQAAKYATTPWKSGSPKEIVLSTVFRPFSYVFEGVKVAEYSPEMLTKVETSLRETGTIDAGLYKQMLIEAQAQSAATGKPVLTLSPKYGQYGRQYTGPVESEMIAVFGSKESAKLPSLFSSSRRFGGVTSGGEAIVEYISFREQSKPLLEVKSGSIMTGFKENIYYPLKTDVRAKVTSLGLNPSERPSFDAMYRLSKLVRDMPENVVSLREMDFSKVESLKGANPNTLKTVLSKEQLAIYGSTEEIGWSGRQLSRPIKDLEMIDMIGTRESSLQSARNLQQAWKPGTTEIYETRLYGQFDVVKIRDVKTGKELVDIYRGEYPFSIEQTSEGIKYTVDRTHAKYLGNVDKSVVSQVPQTAGDIFVTGEGLKFESPRIQFLRKLEAMTKTDVKGLQPGEFGSHSGRIGKDVFDIGEYVQFFSEESQKMYTKTGQKSYLSFSEGLQTEWGRIIENPRLSEKYGIAKAEYEAKMSGYQQPSDVVTTWTELGTPTTGKFGVKFNYDVLKSTAFPQHARGRGAVENIGSVLSQKSKVEKIQLENIVRNYGEQTGALPSAREWTYSKHGLPEHGEAVAARMLEFRSKDPARFAPFTEREMNVAGRLHDIMKRSMGETYPQHGEFVAEKIRSGELDVIQEIGDLTPLEKSHVAEAIGLHTKIRPGVTSYRGIMTKLAWKPNEMSKALATADRLELTRLDITPKKSMMWSFEGIPETQKVPFTTRVSGTIDKISSKVPRMSKEWSETGMTNNLGVGLAAEILSKKLNIGTQDRFRLGSTDRITEDIRSGLKSGSGKEVCSGLFCVSVKERPAKAYDSGTSSWDKIDEFNRIWNDRTTTPANIYEVAARSKVDAPKAYRITDEFGIYSSGSQGYGGKSSTIPSKEYPIYDIMDIKTIAYSSGSYGNRQYGDTIGRNYPEYGSVSGYETGVKYDKPSSKLYADAVKPDGRYVKPYKEKPYSPRGYSDIISKYTFNYENELYGGGYKQPSSYRGGYDGSQYKSGYSGKHYKPTGYEKLYDITGVKYPGSSYRGGYDLIDYPTIYNPKYPNRPYTPRYPLMEYPVGYPEKTYTPKYPEKTYKPDYPKYPEKTYTPDYPKYPEKTYTPENPKYPDKTYKPDYPKYPEKTYKPDYPKYPEKTYNPKYPENPYPPIYPEPPKIPKKGQGGQKRVTGNAGKKPGFYGYLEITPTWTTRQMTTILPTRFLIGEGGIKLPPTGARKKTKDINKQSIDTIVGGSKMSPTSKTRRSRRSR